MFLPEVTEADLKIAVDADPGLLWSYQLLTPHLQLTGVHHTIHNMNQHRKIRYNNLKGLKEDDFR